MERGTHTDLLALEGVYANMWALQQRSMLDSNSSADEDKLKGDKRETNL